jgi:hypothetical protein
MANDDFSLKRFLRVAQVVSTLVGAIIGLLVGAPGNVESMILRFVGGGLAGLMISSCFYLLLVSKDLALAEIPKEELNDSEAVLLKNAGSMVHYKTGRPLRFWEGVGGTLFLTNQALTFRAHKGQPWSYWVTIPIDEIANVKPCKILKIFSGGLRVDRRDGTFELFTFGAMGNSRGWATAILAVRDMSPETRATWFEPSSDSPTKS